MTCNSIESLSVLWTILWRTLITIVHIYGFFSPEKSEHVTVNQHAVFANNETSLKHIKVYGFDYDYTLASYKQELHSLIFRLGKDALVHKYKVITQIFYM